MNDAANQNNRAFITSENKPSVMIVIGRVSINNTGLTTAFSKPRMTADVAATYTVSMLIPAISSAITIKPSTESKKRAMNFITRSIPTQR